MSKSTAGIIQARMGSSRLPGKVMLPLGGRFELEHVVERVSRATEIDTVIVATTTKTADDIVAWCAEDAGVSVFRGDESNVLDRLYRAAKSVDADEVVRITADCPLLDPAVVDEVVLRRRAAGVDYASNILERTFPRGLDVEAFSWGSFEHVYDCAVDPAELEHVTLYYRDNPSEFSLSNVSSTDVYDEESLLDRTDLRLTLDEAADYRLLRAIFDGLEYENTPSFRDAVRYIDDNQLTSINRAVTQKAPNDARSH
ncbi:glycosyltransferase family protein [Haloarculaceae archaeon H-GB2-1]|nr:glycosyltransferase family protein [Haloarculaceae archaeon H-GB1-1]MEA5406528.1 glycosyltransferase family protein [Haloarculaceae archaeon H-GB2-1]